MMSYKIMAINAGSSSLKFQLLEMPQGDICSAVGINRTYRHGKRPVTAKRRSRNGGDGADRRSP